MDNQINQIRRNFSDQERDHDSFTMAHEERVGKLMSLLGKSLQLPPLICDALEIAGSLHDVGKLLLPTEILEKNGPLTIPERNLIYEHPFQGYVIAKKMNHPLSELAAMVILTHHESYDGSGYPRRLRQREIPWAGRICAICDTYDALRKQRPYRQKEYSHEEALSLMQNKTSFGLGHKFDPVLLQSFMKASDLYLSIYEPALTYENLSYI